jgi:hypothetical protein
MDTTESTITLVPKADRRVVLLEEMQEAWSRAPDLRLSRIDVERRWQLDTSTCSELLELLVDRRILARTEDGCFVAAA